MATINYKRCVNFLGRNGTFNQKGIDIMLYGDEVTLQPITSKGDIGRSSVEIPIESIDDVIKQLQKIQKES